MSIEKQRINIDFSFDVDIKEYGEGYSFRVEKYSFFFLSKDRSGWAYEYFYHAFRNHIKEKILNI